MSWRGGAQRFRGSWTFEDELYDTELENQVSFSLGIDFVRFEIAGPAFGSRKVTIVSTHRMVIRMFEALVRVARVEAYKNRKIVPVPKPSSRSAPKRDHRQADNACAWCHGTGEYEGKDGCWIECGHCRLNSQSEQD